MFCVFACYATTHPVCIQDDATVDFGMTHYHLF